MTYRVRHRTTYAYGRDVLLSHHIAHLTPRATAWQEVRTAALAVDPVPGIERVYHDAFGNVCRVFVIQDSHRKLRVDASAEMGVQRPAPPEPASTMPWESLRDGLRAHPIAADWLEPCEFAYASRLTEPVAEVVDYARASFAPGRPALAVARDLCARIHGDFAFDARATTVSTPLRSVLLSRRGVCQDFAHLMLAGLRSRGLAARYVSGYLLTDPPPGQPRLEGADASHAWIAVWCPETGWVELDPTNDQFADDRYITVAWGRDFEDVSPLRGVILGGGPHRPTVGVTVEPLD